MNDGGDDNTTVYPWRERDRDTPFRSRIFNVARRTLVEDSPEPTPRSGEFYTIEATDWVNVVALTADGYLVLVEQWRFAVDRPTLEIPGGMVDPGEGPAAAAERELLEETGFASSEWSKIGVIDPNPAIQANRCHTYLAKNAERHARPRFDGNERCRLVLAPYADVGTLVASGRITHALVVVALHFSRLAEDGLSLPPPHPPAVPEFE